jgi:hypothetical protein
MYPPDVLQVRTGQQHCAESLDVCVLTRHTAKRTKSFASSGIRVYYCIIGVLLSSLLSLLCRLFSIIYLKQTSFLGYTVLRLFCTYNFFYTLCCFVCEIFFSLTLVLPAVCVQCPIWLLYFINFSTHSILSL